MIAVAPTVSIYQQLHDACLPLIEAYHDDLIKHDKTALELTPGVPFLHWTRPCGTTLMLLQPAETYPAIGVRIKYLFGHADRWHILRETVSAATYHTEPANDPAKYTCHHFDGTKLRQISVETAVDVARAYVRAIEAEWNADNKRRGMSVWS